MEINVTTNRLAIISFVTGLIGILTVVLTMLPLLFPPSLENLPEPTGLIAIIMGFSRSVRDLSTFVALVTGILSLREIKKKSGMEKGRLLAWTGIIVGGGWILFRVLIALFFILALFRPFS